MTSPKTPQLVLLVLLAVVASATRSEAVCPGGFPCTKLKVQVSGTTLKITDVSSGDPVDGYAGNFVYVKAKRDEGAVYVAELANGVGFPGSVIAGKGCTAGSFAEDLSGGNPEDVWHHDLLTTWDAKCPLAGLKRIVIDVGAGTDYVNLVLSPIPVKITGGSGDDTLEVWSCGAQYGGGLEVPPYHSTTQLVGGLGSDYLYGGLGDDRLSGQGGDDYLEGACGADKLLAGGGYDEIVSDESSWCENGCTQVRDIVSCGGSEDTVVPDPTDLYSTKQCESVAN